MWWDLTVQCNHLVQYSTLFLWQLVLVHVLVVLLRQLGDPDQKYAHIEEIYTIDYYDMQCVYIVYNSALHFIYNICLYIGHACDVQKYWAILCTSFS